VRDLGPHQAMILRNHGLLVCGATMGRAYKTMVNLEKSCKIQLAVMSSGGKPIRLSEAVMEHAARQFDRDDAPGEKRPDGWPSLLARLDGLDPGYRDL
jgi:ribulose-5-phosphate 4-epimerase/fuculose-1-phosphate aldolase